jgi:DNA-binding transcriptional MocR family regulator
MRVSVNTVKQAYGYLEDRRIIEARPQSGYYVCARLPALPQEVDLKRPNLHPAKADSAELALMIMRDCLNPDLIQFGAAIPNPDLLPVQRLNRMLATETRRFQKESVSYCIPPGSLRLRTQIAKHMVSAGCTLRPDEIVITAGVTEAVQLALQTVCPPGGTLAIESPVYFNFLQMIRQLGLTPLEIPSSISDGISIDALRYAIENTGVNAVLAISNFSNPLGGVIPDEKKKALLKLLRRHNIPFIEDDVQGDLSFADQRPSVVRSFDTSGEVLLCSSFSKTLAPGYRVGWIAPGRYQAEIERQKMIFSIAAPSPNQLAIAEFLANGGYARHLRAMRRVYAKSVACMGEAIGRHFPPGTCVTRPKGGFTLWVELPRAVDSRSLYAQAIKLGITTAPGAIFSTSQRYNNYIRLNAAFWAPGVEWAVEALGRLIKEMVASDPSP